MIVVDLEQGTPEWFAERAGNVSASKFGLILTPTGKRTTGDTRKKYMRQLASEIISGECEESFQSSAMLAGKEKEPVARAAFEEHSGLFVAQVGLCYLDDALRISCSPDGLIGANSGYESKCPIGSTQIEYLEHGKLPTIYIPQVQGCMWVTGRESWHFWSWYPKLKPLHVVVERDEAYIKLQEEAVLEFTDDLYQLVWRLQ